MGATESTTDVLVPRLLRVPDYQRGYAWEHRHVDEFLNDLQLLEPGKTHYTGTVVLLPTGEQLIDDELNSRSLADVVDGQQRLTTICVLINEIRRAFAALDETVQARNLRRLFLIVEKDGVPRAKFQVGTDSHATWMALLTDQHVPDATTLSARRLLDGALQIRDHVQGVIQKADDPPAALRDLYARVANCLQFTLYQVDHQAEVGVIFETLNDRGKPLTELEKAKNYLLFLAARLPTAKQKALSDRINNAWSDIYRLLLETTRVSPVEEDQFLRAHWLATVDPLPARWGGTKSLKAHFRRESYVGKPDLLMLEIGEYVESLAKAAVAYADSIRPDYLAFQQFGELAAQARVAQTRLVNAKTVANFQPLMIAMREREPTDGETYLNILDLCERFAVRTYLIIRYRSDAAQTRLYRLAYDYRSAKISASELAESLRSLTLDYASDSAVRQALLNTERNWYHWGGLKFFLYEYEVALLHGAAPDTEYSYFLKEKREKTIEHVLPQQATSAYWTRHFSNAQIRQLTHALGNLVLTRDNSHYLNFDFPRKRGAAGPGIPQHPCYAQARLAQEQELAAIEDWNSQQVIDRQARLSEWALKRWAVDFSNLPCEPVDYPAADDEDDA
jgi:hypothetical protein